MSALASLLLRDGRVTDAVLRQALERLVLSGQRLDTVLLELDALRENEMAAYLAAAGGLEPATREELDRVPIEVVRRVPVEIARRERVVPIGVRRRTVELAASSPIATEPLEEALDAEVSVRLTTEARLQTALSKYYELPAPARLRRLAVELRDREPGPVPTVEPLADGAALTSGIGSVDPDPEGALAAVRPVDPDEAARALGQAMTRFEVFGALAGLARRSFQYAALFVVEGGLAELVYADVGATGAEPEDLVCHVRESDALGRTATERRVFNGDLMEGRREDRRIARSLGRRSRQPCAFVPFEVSGRVALVVYGDRDGAPIDDDASAADSVHRQRGHRF